MTTGPRASRRTGVLIAVAALSWCVATVGPVSAQGQPDADTGDRDDPAHGAPPASDVIADLADAAQWDVATLPPARAGLRRDRDGSLCLVVDAAGEPAAQATLRRELPLQWPEHFELTLQIKARGALQRVQLRLIGTDGDGVWWHTRAGARLPSRLTELRLTRRDIDFAFGPAADRRLRRTQAIEFVADAAGRGKGALCLARLSLRPERTDAARAGEPRAVPRGGALEVDLGRTRDFSGLVLRWPDGASPLDYEVSADAGVGRWRSVRRVRDSDGGLDALWLPDSRARRLRIIASGQAGATPRLELRSAAHWPDAGAVLAEAAVDVPLGELPRAFVGQQNHWTLVGVDGGGDRSALLSEDGALEIGRRGYSVEPAVLLDDGSLVTWARATMSHTLRDGYLPLPSVQWRHPSFSLRIEAAADGPRQAPEVLARYVLTHHGERPRRYALLLVVRPWQVLPPWQVVGTRGGARPIGSLRWRAGALAVDDAPPLRFSARPAQVTAAPLAARVGVGALLQARPLRGVARDPAGQLSALLRFDVQLAPGATQTIGFVAPLGARAATGAAPDAEALDGRFERAADAWRERLNRVLLRVPPPVQPLLDGMRSALAHVLMSRDDVVLRPGARIAARAGLRDGALIGTALLRLGETDAARDFVDWWASHIAGDGSVPCCIDARGGVDTLAQHDSEGQYLYLVGAVFRHAGDRALLRRHWPHVQRVVARLDALRARAATAPAYLAGLLPPSIGHETYGGAPAYRLADDFWALRGYRDAEAIARALHEGETAERWSAARAAFERDLVAALVAAAAFHRIDHIPGAADRGDLDAASTALTLAPLQVNDALPPALVRATFERWWQRARARADRRDPPSALAPIELRNAGALFALQHEERALGLLEALLTQRRPAGWNQWAEWVPARERAPRDVGDMPQATVAAELVRAVLDLLVREREPQRELVIGAGLRGDWLAQGDVELRGVSTAFGPLDFALRRRPRGWTLQLDRADAPVRLAWPRSEALPKATHRGFPLAWNGRELALPSAPATVELQAPSD